MMLRFLVTAFSALSASACQYGSEAVPAVLADDSEATMTQVRTHLAEAMGTAQVQLGAGDPTQIPVVTVLPPPLGEHETRSPATPTRFNLMIRGDTCYALQEGNTAMFELYGVPCRPL